MKSKSYPPFDWVDFIGRLACVDDVVVAEAEFVADCVYYGFSGGFSEAGKSCFGIPFVDEGAMGVLIRLDFD